MTQNSELIVLGHTKFSDSSIVLHTLGRVYGRRSFLVRVGKRAGMALFLPLSIIEADITENHKSALWSARNFFSRAPLSGIRDSVYKNAMTMFMAEVLFRSLKEGAVEEGLFDWCCSQILTLDALESDYSNFHLLFLLGLASALGFRPRFEDLLPFTGSSTISAGGSSPNPTGSRNLAESTSKSTSVSHVSKLRQLITLPPEEALLVPLTGEMRTAICEDILRYLSFHCESPLNIRSLPVLRELFA